MSEWVAIKRRLPKVVYYPDGSVNCVLVYGKGNFVCGSDIQVANTVWTRKAGRKCITHWMPLPEPPESTP